MKIQVNRHCLYESRSTWLTIFVSAALISSITFSGIDVVKALPPQNCLSVAGSGGNGGAGGTAELVQAVPVVKAVMAVLEEIA